MRPDDEEKLLEQFCDWLLEEQRGKTIEADNIAEWREAFLGYLGETSARNRRRDFISRLMVCGFAHLLTDPGTAVDEGRISRGFIKIFIPAFNQVAEDRFDDDLQQRSKTLLEAEAVQGIAEGQVWKVLLETPATRDEFLDVLIRILHALCKDPSIVESLQEAIRRNTPQGMDGIYQREDVLLIFSAWLHFLVVLANGDGRYSVEVNRRADHAMNDLTRTLSGIPPEIEELYRSVADLYLGDLGV